MKAGESERALCNDCHTEFEVTLEPKAKNIPESARLADTNNTGYCPFCGSDQIELDE